MSKRMKNPRAAKRKVSKSKGATKSAVTKKRSKTKPQAATIYTIFTVTPQQIGALDATRGVELFADLCRAEIARAGLSPRYVQGSLQINVADGGVDVLAEVPADDLFKLQNSFLPAVSHLAFQIKTGDTFVPWQEAHIKKELFGNKSPSKKHLGKSVRACLDADGSYVLVCTGSDPNAKQSPAAKSHLRKFFKMCGYNNPQVDVWGQNRLISMLPPFPSLALRVNGNSKPQFQTHKGWATQFEMKRPFQKGAKQEEFIASALAELRKTDSPIHLHVRGEPGIGKTRLMLEVTAVNDLRPMVIYCDGPAKFLGGELMTELLRDDSQIAAVLVIDECDFAHRSKIWDLLHSQSPRVRLITIYNDMGEPVTSAVQDAPLLDKGQVGDIFEEYGVPKEQTQHWAGFCDGSPRVAHVIGQNLKSHPDDITREPDTVPVLAIYNSSSDRRSRFPTCCTCSRKPFRSHAWRISRVPSKRPRPCGS